MVKTNVTLCSLPLDNPVIPASGTFGYGHEFAELYDINCLGTFSFKGTTREPRLGNPQPRIAEMQSGVLNAVGLQNPGVDAVITEDFPSSRAFSASPSWQMSAAFRSMNTSRSAKSLTPARRSAGSR